MAGFLDLSPKSICGLVISTPLFWLPQRPQGCQKIHKNILQKNLTSICPKNQAKFKIKLKNLKNCKKNRTFFVYSLIRAKPAFDIDITTVHNSSDQKTVEFLSRNFPVYMYGVYEKKDENLLRCTFVQHLVVMEKISWWIYTHIFSSFRCMY